MKNFLNSILSTLFRKGRNQATSIKKNNEKISGKSIGEFIAKQIDGRRGVFLVMPSDELNEIMKSVLSYNVDCSSLSYKRKISTAFEYRVRCANLYWYIEQTEYQYRAGQSERLWSNPVLRLYVEHNSFANKTYFVCHNYKSHTDVYSEDLSRESLERAISRIFRAFLFS